nr:MAG TPA: hypothetical protein [Caudoviricetes sp.]
MARANIRFFPLFRHLKGQKRLTIAKKLQLFSGQTPPRSTSVEE